MASLTAFVHYLMPWEFSPTVVGLCAAFLVVYLRGMRMTGRPVSPWRHLGFLVGLVSIYVCLQTYVDYLSQHMFWVHRIQHLVLHHLGPFLIALAAPDEILARGLPAPLLRPVRWLWKTPIVRGLYRIIQSPLIACGLFVGLIYIWLTPSIHLDAMLSIFWYKVMNWSMVVDGLLFWWLIVGPETSKVRARPGHGARMIMLLAITLPQIAIGAYITFHTTIIYDSYSICGRAWSISPLVDQQLGGLNTWIPPAMMSVLGFVIVVSRWMRVEAPSSTSPLHHSIQEEVRPSAFVYRYDENPA